MYVPYPPAERCPARRDREPQLNRACYWDSQSTTNDLDKYRLSSDDLALKLSSRQHKPIADYSEVNLVRKMREDGTTYVTARKPYVPKPNPEESATRRRKATSDDGKENSGPDGESDSCAVTSVPPAQARHTAALTTTAPKGATRVQQRSASTIPGGSAEGHSRPQSAPATRSSSTDSRSRTAAPGAGPAEHEASGVAAQPKQGALRVQAGAAPVDSMAAPMRAPVPGPSLTGRRSAVRAASSARGETWDERPGHLAAAEQELRTALELMERAAGRESQPLERMYGRAGSYTEMLLRATTRLCGVVAAAEERSAAFMRDAAEARREAAHAAAEAASLRADLALLRKASARALLDAQQENDVRIAALEEEQVAAANQLASLCASREFLGISSLLSSALSPQLPGPVPPPAASVAQVAEHAAAPPGSWAPAGQDAQGAMPPGGQGTGEAEVPAEASAAGRAKTRRVRQLQEVEVQSNPLSYGPLSPVHESPLESSPVRHSLERLEGEAALHPAPAPLRAHPHPRPHPKPLHPHAYEGMRGQQRSAY